MIEMLPVTLHVLLGTFCLARFAWHILLLISNAIIHRWYWPKLADVFVSLLEPLGPFYGDAW